jgi:hypothetical protein
VAAFCKEPRSNSRQFFLLISRLVKAWARIPLVRICQGGSDGLFIVLLLCRDPHFAVPQVKKIRAEVHLEFQAIVTANNSVDQLVTDGVI